MRTIAVIPARLASERFPGKVLADETGRPLIRHVWDRARAARRVDDVVVAADDASIVAAVETFGGRAMLTRSDHANGTSRIAEVAPALDADVIVNVQGDEPEIEPAVIDAAVDALVAHDDCPVATVASPFADAEDPGDPNIVKVVVDRAGRALYFSRALVPHVRGGGAPPPDAAPLKHVGLYVYRRAFLATYVTLEPTPLEAAEKLEQLRILEHGHRIAVAVVDEPGHAGIDTPAQYAAFVARWRARS